MTTTYKRLFQIQCRHSYFADHVCRALTIAPTSPCARLLNRYGMLFRSDNGGASIYYTDDGSPTPLRLFDETTPLSFVLTNPDRQLESITEIPLALTKSPDETVYYFNNLQENSATVDGIKSLLLHPTGNPFAAEPIAVRPAQFVYEFETPVTAVKLQLIDVLQREVWTGQTPDGKTVTYSLNLSTLTAGRYRLNVPGGKPYDFYLSDLSPANCWGVVDIFPGGPALDKAVPKRCQAIDATGVPLQAAPFTIALEARQSIWRYYIVSQSSADRAYGSYQVVGGAARNGKANGSPSIAFTKATTQKLNGQDAWVFESSTPIPLYEMPSEQHEFSLKSTGLFTPAKSFALPYARSNSTRLERAGNETRMCSEIFVYL